MEINCILISADKYRQVQKSPPVTDIRLCRRSDTLSSTEPLDWLFFMERRQKTKQIWNLFKLNSLRAHSHCLQIAAICWLKPKQGMIVSDLIFILLLFLFCSLPVWNISPQHRVKKRALHHNMVAEAPSVSYYWCNRPLVRMWFLCVRVWMCAFADCIAIFPRAFWVCIWYPVTSGWWKVSSRIDGHNGHSSTDTQIQVWGFLLAALQLRVKLNIHLEAKMQSFELELDHYEF